MLYPQNCVDSVTSLHPMYSWPVVTTFWHFLPLPPYHGSIATHTWVTQAMKASTQRVWANGCDWRYEIRYDTRCYFNVRSKADTSQLNLPHGTWKTTETVADFNSSQFCIKNSDLLKAGLTPRVLQTVYGYFSAHQFLLFRSSFFPLFSFWFRAFERMLK